MITILVAVLITLILAGVSITVYVINIQNDIRKSVQAGLDKMGADIATDLAPLKWLGIIRK